MIGDTKFNIDDFGFDFGFELDFDFNRSDKGVRRIFLLRFDNTEIRSGVFCLSCSDSSGVVSGVLVS